MKKKIEIEYTWTDDRGTKYWCKGDKDNYHRINGPAVEYSDGGKRYFVDGEYHRIDGPAFEDANGHKEWVVNGKLHRLDGPAIIYEFGKEVWYVDDLKLDCSTQAEFEQLMKLKAFW